jgi:hypothetical protein
MTLSELLTLIQRVTKLRQWIFATFIVVATSLAASLLVYWPQPSPVRVSGSVLTLELQCVPTHFAIYLHGLPADDVSASASTYEGDQLLSGPSLTYILSAVERKHDLTVFNLAPSEIQTAVRELRDSERAVVNVHVGRVPSLDIVRIVFARNHFMTRCPFATFEGSQLNGIIVNPDANVRHLRLTQEMIGDLTFKFNETVGNVLLAAMVIAMFWVIGYVSAGLTFCYFVSDKSLKKTIDKRKKEIREHGISDGLVEVLEMDFVHLERRMSFARAVAPALGFLLTVSSLIAALHPSVQIEQDAFRFVTSLQLAMTAKLVGLLIRIAAEFAIRLHRNVALRKIAMLAG